VRALALTLFLVATLIAKAVASPTATKDPERPRPAASPSAAPSPAPDRLPSIKERLKDVQVHDGFLPWAWDAKKGQLLLEVPEGGELLYACGLAGGGGLIEADVDRGAAGDLALCRFERVGPRVLLVQRQTGQRAESANPEQVRAAEESFPRAVLAGMAVVAEAPDRALVDATEFLTRDSFVVKALKDGQAGDFHADPARSAVALARSDAFPENTELEADLTFACDAPPPATVQVLPDGHTMTLRMHHSFVRPPAAGYEPRALDPRVGFIPLTYRDHAAPFDQPIDRAWVMRWRPGKHLVFYLDRGIPEPERTAVREGMLWWNHAFAEAGWPGLLEVRDLPAGATFLDMRYSGVEWVNRSERAWSLGQSQVDPRTGEILHAVVRLDSHRRRTTARIAANAREPRGACAAADAPDPALALGEGDPLQRRLVLERLSYLAAHEVGHTLGLMHNMAATTYGWGSVMDYLSPAIRTKGDELDFGDCYPHDVGSYDRLCIRWGYTAGLSDAARDQLVLEAYRAGVVLPHPEDHRWNEYDVGADPLAWLRTCRAVRRKMLQRFGPGQLPQRRSLHELTERFSLAYLYHRFAIAAVQHEIGGLSVTNALAGDGQVPLQPVSKEQQQLALEELLVSLEPGELEVPARVAAVLVPVPAGLPETRERFASATGDVFDAPTAERTLAGLVVEPLFEPRRAARLASVRPEDGLTLGQVVDRVVQFSLGSWHERVVPVVVQSLINLAASADATPEVRTVVLGRLIDLRGKLTDVALARELSSFLDHPELYKPRGASPSAPPGRPIGEPAR